MRCCHCKQKEATKSYEQLKKGKSVVEYYCMDCYHQLFLEENAKTDGETLSVCPYCGMSLQEVSASKLVGCAHCYATMRKGVNPLVIKMQGDRAHKGKTPPLEYGETQYGGEVYDDILRLRRIHSFGKRIRGEVAGKTNSGGNYDFFDKLRRVRHTNSSSIDDFERMDESLSA